MTNININKKHEGLIFKARIKFQVPLLSEEVDRLSIQGKIRA
jgi:hypothetical protein